jgi:CBS domain-containing protein
MQVSEVMTKDVIVVEADASLQEAAQLMRGLDVGLLPVREGGRLVGMLSDRDITVRATAEGRAPAETRVADVMSRSVVACGEADDVLAAAGSMQTHQLRRLVVVDGFDRIVGIVSLGDLALRSDERLAGRVLERVSEPAAQPNLT